ncbi:MAG: FecR domain-containing protein, partial [Patescibacteria group bacterium]
MRKKIGNARLLAVFLLLLCVVFAGRRAFCETSPEPAAETGSISMDFDGAPLSQVLRVFSQLSGLNFVASDRVKSEMISVYFDHVPVQDALESLIKANNLRYEKKEDSKIFLVYPAESAGTLETKIFAL